MRRLTVLEINDLKTWFNKTLDLAIDKHWSLDEFLMEIMYAGFEKYEEYFLLRECGHNYNFKKHFKTTKKYY